MRSTVATRSGIRPRRNNVRRYGTSNGAVPPSVGRQWHQALILAARSGRTGMLHRLLGRPGLDVDWRDPRGWTALMWAVTEGHAATVRELLRYGADPWTDDPWGVTAFEIAEERGRNEIAADLRWADRIVA